MIEGTNKQTHGGRRKEAIKGRKERINKQTKEERKK